MKRSDFLKNALMAVAVSLLPKVLRPVEHLFEAGEVPTSPVVSSIFCVDPRLMQGTPSYIIWTGREGMEKVNDVFMKQFQKQLNNKS